MSSNNKKTFIFRGPWKYGRSQASFGSDEEDRRIVHLRPIGKLPYVIIN
jgi:hypothetical protein